MNKIWHRIIFTFINQNFLILSPSWIVFSAKTYCISCTITISVILSDSFLIRDIFYWRLIVVVVWEAFNSSTVRFLSQIFLNSRKFFFTHLLTSALLASGVYSAPSSLMKYCSLADGNVLTAQCRSTQCSIWLGKSSS